MLKKFQHVRPQFSSRPPFRERQTTPDELRLSDSVILRREPHLRRASKDRRRPFEGYATA
ncbi:MAG: hypothetical protein BGP05_15045 [Rhizobiales bacterium 62-47]|nr:MAG: hypothetical protein BGP05_15045 [Rhizobiales bacterium 62-47]